jgi:DNA-binding transcriptional LysR family regulator
VDIENLKTYINVVKYRSFSKAAEVLHISQPAVSSQIIKLEQELGTPLIIRRKNGVSMTSAGRTLFNFSEYVFYEHSCMLRNIQQLTNKQARGFNFISSPIPAEFLIPNILIGFKEKYYPIGINLTVETTIKVIESVILGNNEAGFCSKKVVHSELEFTKIAEDFIVLVVCSNHPLANKKEISLYELSGETIITRDSIGIKTGEEYLLGEAGLDFSLFESHLIMGTFSGVISLVVRGGGIAFLPYLSVIQSEALGLVKILKVKDISIKREYFFLHRKDMYSSQSLKDFKHFLMTDFHS